MGCLRGLGLYLVKTGIQKRRHPCSLLCECLGPVILICLFAWLHSLVHVDHYETEAFQCSDMDASFTTDTKSFLMLPATLTYSNQLIGVAGPPEVREPFMNHVRQLYPGLPGDVLRRHNCSILNFLPGVPPLADRIVEFDTAQQVNEYVAQHGYGVDPTVKPLWAALVFNQSPLMDSSTAEWDYTLRFNTSVVPDTTVAVNPLQRKTDADYQHNYWYGTLLNQDILELAGFVPLQLAVDKFILNRTASASMDESGDVSEYVTAATADLEWAPQFVETAPFPQTAFSKNNFYDLAKAVFAMFFVLSFLFPASRLIRGLVLEKETKIREGMRMMGLSDWALFTAWYLVYTLLFAAVALLVTIICKVSMFPKSSVVIMFFYFLIFGIASIAVCFTLSTFFSRSKIATTVGTVIYLATFFPYYAVNGDSTSSGNKVLASILPSVGFALSLDVLATLEDNGVGVTSATFNSEYSNFTFSAGFFMMVFDCILFTLLGWYLDNVIPSEFGVNKPFYFCCRPRYWCGSCLSRKKTSKRPHRGVELRSLSSSDDLEDRQALLQMEYKAEAADRHDAVDYPLEDPGQHARQLEAAGRAVSIRGLRKVFDTPDGDKVAVNGVDLTMYEGQIFALLGHNGAGKTTTISMLTGLMRPTAGKASVFGHDILEDMGAIRHQMGVCPQHDVLWDDLTVSEHLKFFAGLKNVPSDQVQAAVDKIIQDVGLTEKVNVKSSELSGGQKRKLSVAIALVGDSKVVFLDEPTSGMDPYSRRSTWNILQNAREGRIMILTTHFMDEADLLGDRIAIMADGKVQCVGSPMFLKRQYGVGYNLTMVKAESLHDTSTLKGTVKRHVNNCTVLSDVGSEMVMQLPLAAAKHFPDLFAQLETEGESLGVVTYGISVTTLEEVFLKVAEAGDVRDRTATRELSRQLSTVMAERQSSTGSTGVRKGPSGVGAGAGAGAGAGVGTGSGHMSDVALSINDSEVSSLLSGKGTAEYHRDKGIQGSLFATHFRSLFRKRFRFARRDKKAICFQLVIPIIALLLGLSLLKSVHIKTPPSVILSAKSFNVVNGVRSTLNVPAWGHDQDAVEGLTDRFTQRFGDTTSSFVDLSPYNYSDCGGFSLPAAMDFIQSPQFASSEGVDLSWYLLDAKHQSPVSNYGALLLYDSAPSTTTSPVPATTETRLWYEVLQNSTAPHATPVFVNMVNDAALRWITGNSDSQITVRSEPFPYTQRQKDNISNALSFTAVLFVVIAFSFIPASFAVFVVKEREVNAKHQQLISGVSIPAYWLATYCWDIVNYLLPCILSVILILLFDIKQLVGTANSFGATVLLFLFYGLAVAAQTYVFSYMFKSHSTAQTVVLVINLFCMLLLIASFVMGFIESTCKVNQALEYVFRLMPGFALGNGLIQLTVREQLKFTYTDCGRWDQVKAFEHDWQPFDWIITGSNLTYLVLEAIVYFGVAVAIDWLLSYPAIRAAVLPDSNKAKESYEVDEDVVKEEDRVMSGHADDDMIVIKKLRKVYGGKKVAVRDLSFGIPRGECFGFLGINGAGKTSTLKMLSGDIIPTSGTATLGGFDILQQQMQVRRLLGYCPQFDALFELLTTREHLELYARIKGVPKPLVENVVQDKMREMDLKQFENKLAGRLSGGNRRKLSVAIAMIGDPPLVFLDEPSTGMDPVARRFMWNIIARIATVNKQCSIILTTHSMEECEALCTRLGIMVGGRLRCLGAPQHLKSRFGQGYQAELRLEQPKSDMLDAFRKAIESHCSGDALPKSNLSAALLTLGNAGREELLHPDHSGWAIHSALEHSGEVPVAEFGEWYIMEDWVAAVVHFMSQRLPGSTLAERHGQALRFKVPFQQDKPLSRIFALMEEHKATLHISEYSLSQTSLEQIFNTFAMQQAEEQGTVRGFQS